MDKKKYIVNNSTDGEVVNIPRTIDSNLPVVMTNDYIHDHFDEAYTEYEGVAELVLSICQRIRPDKDWKMYTIDPPLFEESDNYWIETKKETGALGIKYSELKCAHCGWTSSLIIPRNYCPNCGTKMLYVKCIQEE